MTKPPFIASSVTQFVKVRNQTESAMVLHAVPTLHPGAGGPSRTVIHLTDALAEIPGTAITLLSQGLIGAPLVASASEQLDLRVMQSKSPMALKFGLPIKSELFQITRRQLPPNLVHSHGLWAPATHWAADAARQWGSPLIVQPRGMLEPWALRQKAWKKKIAMALFQRRDLAQASVFVATAEMEFESIRALGFCQPIAVIPNGVLLDERFTVRSETECTGRGVRTALFLSRIHPQKGILNLLQAWAEVAPAGWRLQIAGPDEGGHLDEVAARAQNLGIADAVDYLGEVDGQAKTSAYGAADLFVLPTYSENFGVVVAEALAHGVPVITTQGAPWADLATYGCGWWVEIGVAPLAGALRQATGLSDNERRAMGARGREYVKRYDWPRIAQQTFDVYQWVLGRGSQPDCVRTD